MENTKVPQKQLTKIKIDLTGKNKVTLHFRELVEGLLPGNGEESEEDASIVSPQYIVKSPYAPHPDLLNEMKKLRKFALEICEMEIGSKTKELSDYNVSAVKISGDVSLKQSRAVLTVTKEVQRTGKVIEFDTPQVTMYGESDFERAAELSDQIERVIDQAWLYVGGKYQEEGQLALFERVTLQLS